MNLSRHDRALLAVTVFVVLFGIVGAVARRSVATISERRAQAASLERRIRMQRNLIAAEDAWRARYDAVKDRMPVFTPGQQVETYWMTMLDQAADRHGVRIFRHDLRDEAVVAGVCELPIEVRSWEGTLEALVGFIHDIESTGAMLEIRELRVSPDPKRQGWLKGNFTLHCAYLRAPAGS